MKQVRIIFLIICVSISFIYSCDPHNCKNKSNDEISREAKEWKAYNNNDTISVIGNDSINAFLIVQCIKEETIEDVYDEGSMEEHCYGTVDIYEEYRVILQNSYNVDERIDYVIVGDNVSMYHMYEIHYGGIDVNETSLKSQTINGVYYNDLVTINEHTIFSKSKGIIKYNVNGIVWTRIEN